MLAVFKKELRSYFTSMTGYVFMAFFVAVVGIYFLAYNLNYGYPYFTYSLSSASFVYIIIVPILTMRIIAEERKQKTDQLLLTAPVSIVKIILGKYLSLLAILAIPIAMFCLYPLILTQFGKINFQMTYTGILGYFLLGATFMAVGMFISSITESMVIAAVLSFGVLFLSYMCTGLADFISSEASASYIGFMLIAILVGVIMYIMTANYTMSAVICLALMVADTVLYFVKSSLFESALPNMLNALSLTKKFSDLSSGMFDLTAIVYYISVSGLFIFFTVQSVQKRRYS
ncbi:ABC-2 type transport system permease protein [Acetitomaculum ruminis DSM 5522]|uniref:ABC-2 type transport system permease protein n=1 Tax=Acetitomaculum ruminis DSM 5522 TaxID=1120918 RepID=A0A1I0Z6A5_9FIRM|nr:ABC transporter permease subunit [Acetitomaculum ruminis]SFB20952.1 ABC-2 type transport system permease protein [Acetitomaculum ruminis DSM 5522]